MLKLTLKVGERVGIGSGVVVELCRIKGQRAMIGVIAPAEQVILRESLVQESEPPAGNACMPAENP